MSKTGTIPVSTSMFFSIFCVSFSKVIFDTSSECYGDNGPLKNRTDTHLEQDLVGNSPAQVWWLFTHIMYVWDLSRVRSIKKEWVRLIFIYLFTS